jgi:hypothetical protein
MENDLLTVAKTIIQLGGLLVCAVLGGRLSDDLAKMFKWLPAGLFAALLVAIVAIMTLGFYYEGWTDANSLPFMPRTELFLLVGFAYGVLARQRAKMEND